MMKIAIVYDRVNKWGGAERVLLALHKIFPDAPLYTSVYEPSSAAWAKEFDVHTTFLQKVPYAQLHHELFAIAMPIAFESFNFDDYDLVISVTSESAKGILTKRGTKHICICLTPTRYIWSGYEEYFKNTFLRWLAKPTVSYLRLWDRIASARPDAYIAISHEVESRIKKFYNRNATVIFPPLMLNQTKKTTPYTLHPTPYFLIVTRLVPYKKIDLAIQAFNSFGASLKIVGTGSEYAYLRSIAKSNIEFLDMVSDERLQELYHGAQAFIFPGTEDFGLTMIEAQSFGIPVIAHRSGGALDIVREGVTGEFFDAQTSEGLIKCLQNFNSSRYNRKNCIENAQRFSFEHFKKQLMAFINTKI